MHFHKDGALPTAGEIFVFGSNLAGRHGAGAARVAFQQYGAILGQGQGLQGQSYAIPTKDAALKSLPLEMVYFNVQQFLGFAQARPHLRFFVTRVGCGLAGNADVDIAPFFSSYLTGNLSLPEPWRHLVF
jgi:hypothetical protein